MYAHPRKRDITNQIPCVCPPKYHYDYYRKYISSSSIAKQYSFILEILLNFCAGELDFSHEFFESTVWKEIQFALNDRKLPSFGVNRKLEEDDKHKYHVHLCGNGSYSSHKKNKIIKHMMIAESSVLENSLDLNECRDIISALSPIVPANDESINNININWNEPTFQKYNKMRKMGIELSAILNKMKMDGCDIKQYLNATHSKPPQSTKIFYDTMKEEYFESIWFWMRDGTRMNAGDYGEYEQYHWMCATLNGNRFRAKKSGNKIYIKIWVSHYTDDDDRSGTYKLRFDFSDSLELFWSESMSNWQYFQSWQIRQFDPNQIQKTVIR